jgi:SAM-dependent methyltransferase
MKKLIGRIERAVSGRVLRLYDRITDRRICGQSLVKTVAGISEDKKKGIGGTASQSTHYLFLKYIFSHVSLTESDTLIDVGCGKGRVLAFLIKENCPCRICGIEYNEAVGKIAQEWTAKYEQAEVLIGDAFQLDYNDYTVLTLARPFLPVTFCSFIQKLEETLVHPITLVSWYDQNLVRYVHNRPGWHAAYHEMVKSVHGWKIALYPSSFTVWTYDPDERKAQEAKAEADA